MKREDIEVGMRVIVTSPDLNLGAPTPGIVHYDDGEDLWPISVQFDGRDSGCFDSDEIEPEVVAPVIDWQAIAAELAACLTAYQIAASGGPTVHNLSGRATAALQAHGGAAMSWDATLKTSCCDSPRGEWGYTFNTGPVVDWQADADQLREVLEALRCSVAFDSRDWANSGSGDAWRYGILCGWRDDESNAITEIAERFPRIDIAYMERLHSAIAAHDEAVAQR